MHCKMVLQNPDGKKDGFTTSGAVRSVGVAWMQVELTPRVRREPAPKRAHMSINVSQYPG